MPRKKSQKRRTVSFPPDVYEILMEHAGKEELSISHFVIEKLRAAGVPLPKTTHMEYAATIKARHSREVNRAREAEVGVTAPR